MVQSSSTLKRAFFNCFADVWQFHPSESVWEQLDTDTDTSRRRRRRRRADMAPNAARERAGQAAAEENADTKSADSSNDGDSGKHRGEAAAVERPVGRGSHTAVVLAEGDREVMLIYGGFACADSFQVRT